MRAAEISFPVTNPVLPRSLALSSLSNMVSRGVSDLGGGVATRDMEGVVSSCGVGDVGAGGGGEGVGS